MGTLMNTAREKILNKMKYQVENQLKYAAWGTDSDNPSIDTTNITETGVSRVRVTPHNPTDATPYGSVTTPKSITDITQATEGEVTIGSSGMGIRNGDIVYIDGVTGMTEVNDRFYYIKEYHDDAPTPTFKIINPADGKGGTGIDTSNYTAYEGGGNLVYPQYGWCWDLDTYDDKYVAKCYAKFDDSNADSVSVNEIGFYSHSSGNNLQARLVPTKTFLHGSYAYSNRNAYSCILNENPFAIEMYIEVFADYTHK